jgi:hypothetical protein
MHEQTAVIDAGVQEGEHVVVDGQQRLASGTKIKIVEDKKP